MPIFEQFLEAQKQRIPLGKYITSLNQDIYTELEL